MRIKPESAVAMVSEAMQESIGDVNRLLNTARKELNTLKTESSRIRKHYRSIVKFIGAKNIRRTWVNASGINNGINFYVTMKHTDSLQSIEIMAALAQLLDDGWEATKSSDYAEYLNRSHYLSKGRYKLTIDTYAKSDSPTCRKVLIGQETQVVPKYKIECDSIFK